MGEPREVANNLANGMEGASPLQQWLANELFKVDWNPLVEHRRYTPMEGHLELFNEHETDPEQVWRRLYFRTNYGRLQWFASHCADEHPISDILLTGAQVRASKEDWTLELRGGKEKADLRLKAPSNMFEKWHQTLLSHSGSSLVDAYVQPVFPPIPHRTNRVLLLELGGQSIRAGILSQKPSLPHTFIPALCAVLGADSGDEQQKRVLAGTEALAGEAAGQLVQPIQIGEEGTRLDRPALLALLQKVRAEAALQAKAMDIRFREQDFSVLLSMPQHMDVPAAREVLGMLLDGQKLAFKSVSLVRQPSLALYSYDVTSGVVVDLGEHFSIVPVIDEFVVEEALRPVPFGARQLREQLGKRVQLQSVLLAQGQEPPASPMAQELLLRFLVEKTCYVAPAGLEEERRRAPKGAEAELDMAGRKVPVQVDAETRFAPAEGLFQPGLWGLEGCGGLHQLVHEAIQRCPIDHRRPLYRAIYLTGGTSLLRGLAQRLERELAQLVAPSTPVQVLNSPWRRHSAFLGAHLIAAADEFPNCCVGEADLGEYLRRMSSAATDT